MQVTVLDMKGNEIYNATQEMNASSKQRIDLSGHSKGIYFVQFKPNFVQFKSNKEQLAKTIKIVLE